MDQPHVEDRELRLGEILKSAWQIFKNNFKVLLPAFLLYVLLTLLSAIFTFYFKHESPHNILSFTSFLPFAVFTNLITITIALIVDAAIKSDEITFKEAIKSAFHIWPNSLIANFLKGLIILGLLMPLIILWFIGIIIFRIFGLVLLLGVPVIIAQVYLKFVTFAVALDDKKDKEALKFSKGIVTNRWWRVFGIILFFTLSSQIPLFTYWIIFGFKSFAFAVPSIRIIPSFVSSLIFCFIVVAEIVFYKNLVKFPVKSHPARANSET